MTGYDIVASSLAQLGITHMFGVIGIPVTQMASAAQAAGIRFISCRNEQAAGYAAAAAGFLTGKPGVLLTVSGPGMVHGIAGLSHARENRWPLIMISGSCETVGTRVLCIIHAGFSSHHRGMLQDEVGKGAFQEHDQCRAAMQYVKLAIQAKSVEEIPQCISRAYETSLQCGFGPCYIDIPSTIFMGATQKPVTYISPSPSRESRVSDKVLSKVLSAVQNAKRYEAMFFVFLVHGNTHIHILCNVYRPLIVLGAGGAAEHAEGCIERVVHAWKVPFISSSMGRGVVPDSSIYCANAARSLALSKSDVVVVLGAALNWQLHFGEPPKWSKDAKFILVDSYITPRDKRVAHISIEGPIEATVQRLLTTPIDCTWMEWNNQITAKVRMAKEKLDAKLSVTAHPLDYKTTLRVIRSQINAIDPAPVVVSEGANTMDQARILLEPVNTPRCRLDAGAWGTMGIGLGCAIAAATTTGRNVVAVEGDSAFGFSGMEIETICRYNLPVTIIVFNNGGIYGGDRRTDSLRQAAVAGLESAGFPQDPAPTSFVPDARYDMLAIAFGGDGYNVKTADDLEKALSQSLLLKRPSIINVAIDPQAGVESGTVHSFNAPKKS